MDISIVAVMIIIVASLIINVLIIITIIIIISSSLSSSSSSYLSGGSSYTGGCATYMLSLTGLTPTTNDQVIPGGYYLMPETYKVRYDSRMNECIHGWIERKINEWMVLIIISIIMA